ncbi:LysR family transcriptional regulator [Rhodobacter sp. NTK016B]|uniref:LysR substrate-binding domain-containing protein n=1 Tax=Rhodobacter sp. NTK016B TaxID=2759676 RepID=UPI001A8C89BC|nr:LysR substrate-binding domain-containing protein [Rhodobacter sp. NTK016B]MBN8292065.1 LysR family transcriptional regulator [Rhodobacter sp. NTK016B]
MPSFDMDALRTIVVGTDLGSFARAAVQLGRSQSAVSMQLKKLEHQAGAPLFLRKGRGLVPTEAGEALIAYARRIIALNDEAAQQLGAASPAATVRLGLPQDFFDDVMPATLTQFTRENDDVHVDIRAGDNHRLADEVRAGRLDAAIAFFRPGSAAEGETLCELPMRWFAHRDRAGRSWPQPLPLVLFDHPCLFRQATLAALDQSRIRWRAALTTPSLPAIWGALRSGLGIAVRTDHGKPEDIVALTDHPNLPALPNIEVRLLRAPDLSRIAERLADTLRAETLTHVAPGAAPRETC